MASSVVLAPSVDKANFFRLTSLLIDGGRLALRSVFDKMIPPVQLQAHLRAHCQTLQKLKLKRRLNQAQEDLLFPPHGSAVSSANFDITLFCLLLRNICGLNEPATGWDNPPLGVDQSIEADIIRLRISRNEIQHANQSTISKTDFENQWTEIKEVLLRIGNNLSDLEENIDRLKNDGIDPEKENVYKITLRQWEFMDKKVSEDVEKLKAKTITLEEDVKVLKERVAAAENKAKPTTAVNSTVDDLKSTQSLQQRLSRVTIGEQEDNWDTYEDYDPGDDYDYVGYDENGNDMLDDEYDHWGYDDTYDDGNDDTYDDGNDDTYDDGNDDNGNDDTYGDGNDDTYDDGNDDTYDDGNDDTYGDGNDDTYDDGNDDTYDDGNDFYDDE